MNKVKGMKDKLFKVVAVLIFGAQLFAQTTTGEASTPETKTAQSDADLRMQVEELRKLVLHQQQEIDALKAERKPGTASPEAISSVSPEPAPANDPAKPQTVLQADLPPQNSGSSDERVRNLERLIRGLGPISFSGDIRLREEPFFGGPADGSLDRARTRLRARFNAIADLGEQFRVGVALATGDINDPISTNQDLTGFYTRKTFALDQAFIEYKPNWFKQASFVGGKFRYPWYNTELTWDKDLNPEGAAQTLAFNVSNPVLKRIAFVGFELPFTQVAGTSADKSIVQHITYGGQVQTMWQLAPRVQLSAYSGFYDFRGADAIALAQAKASSKNPQTPFTGVLPLANPGPNSTFTTVSNTVITIGRNVFPTGVTTVSNSQFGSRFGLFDNIVRLDLNTGNPKMPISLIGDYVQNTEACANLGKILPVPTNTSTSTFVQTVNAPCNPHARHGYWLEGRIGRLQQRGDWQAGYTGIYLEREAALGGFNYSELRQSTNVTQHRFDVFYQADKSIQLGFTALLGRPLASTENWLTRLQFDTIYIF